MIKINYPTYQPKIKTENKKEFIFDEVRKKWIVLTPEEWVRQNFIQYLIQVELVPASLIAVEKEIKIGELKKRFDIVVFKNAIPHILIECKKPSATLSAAVLNQAIRYYTTVQASYIVITNGAYTAAYTVNDGTLIELASFPK